MSNISFRLAERLRRSGASVAFVAAAVLFSGLVLHLSNSVASEAAVKIPPAAVDETSGASGLQTAVFAGGCFWGVQGVFQRVNGVTQAVSGYSGGSKETATYEMIGTGMTGHAEAVQITYDPKKVSYAALLQVFFSVAHDPTQLNRQEPDVGPQYRSAVFYGNAAQKQTVERYIAQLDTAKSYPRKIVTQVVPLQAFYAAEAYHQDYMTLHPESGYIARYDLPKVANLKSIFPDLYRAEPVLVMARAKAAGQKPPQ
jgi:peptide-methionine (S)-S-oxide reductase